MPGRRPQARRRVLAAPGRGRAMTTSRFVAVIPGALEDHAAEHDLSGTAASVYRYLRDNADRVTGVFHGTITAISEDSRFARRAVSRALADLVDAGLVKLE